MKGFTGLSDADMLYQRDGLGVGLFILSTRCSRKSEGEREKKRDLLGEREKKRLFYFSFQIGFSVFYWLLLVCFGWFFPFFFGSNSLTKHSWDQREKTRVIGCRETHIQREKVREKEGGREQGKCLLQVHSLNLSLEEVGEFGSFLNLRRWVCACALFSLSFSHTDL